MERKGYPRPETDVFPIAKGGIIQNTRFLQNAKALLIIEMQIMGPEPGWIESHVPQYFQFLIQDILIECRIRTAMQSDLRLSQKVYDLFPGDHDPRYSFAAGPQNHHAPAETKWISPVACFRVQ